MKLNGETYSYTNANSKTLKFLELTDIDMWMTEFMITSNQLYLKNKLKQSEVKVIEKLTDTYRSYLSKNITTSSMTTMRSNISDFIQGNKPVSVSKTFRTEPRGVTVKFGMQKQEQDIKEEKFDDSKLFNRNIEELTENEKNERFRVETERNFIQMQMNIALQMEQKDPSQMNTNVILAQVLNTVNELKEEAMERKMDKDTLMNTSFSLWPSKLKKMVASGFKNALRNLVVVPITAPFMMIHTYVSLGVGGLKMMTSPFYKLLKLYCGITLIGNMLFISFKPDLISISPDITKSIEAFRIGIADMGKPYALLSSVNNHLKQIATDIDKTGDWNAFNDEKYITPDSITNINRKQMLTSIKKSVQLVANPSLIVFNTVTDYEKPLEGYYEFMNSAVQSAFITNSINLINYFKENTKYEFCNNSPLGYVGCGNKPTRPLPVSDQLKLSIKIEKENLKEHRMKQDKYKNCMFRCGVAPGEYDMTNLEKLEKLASNPTLYGKISSWINSVRKFWDSIDENPNQVPENIPKI